MEASVGSDYIIELIAQLPERQRLVATLIFIEEMTPNEIGKRYDIDPQSIRRSIRSAKEKLQELINQDQHDRPQ